MGAIIQDVNFEDLKKKTAGVVARLFGKVYTEDSLDQAKDAGYTTCKKVYEDKVSKLEAKHSKEMQNRGKELSKTKDQIEKLQKQIDKLKRKNKA